MKIKLLKDIPGYKAGEIHDSEEIAYVTGNGYTANILFDSEFLKGSIERIEDDTDIEEIRRSLTNFFKDSEIRDVFNQEEMKWFNSYRIVKAVIEGLNGDWKRGKTEDMNAGYEIYFSEAKFKIYPCNNSYSINPKVQDVETAEKVISLCESELKVLFNIK